VIWHPPSWHQDNIPVFEIHVIMHNQRSTCPFKHSSSYLQCGFSLLYLIYLYYNITYAA